jgi:hypothetical protein
VDSIYHRQQIFAISPLSFTRRGVGARSGKFLLIAFLAVNCLGLLRGKSSNDFYFAFGAISFIQFRRI